MVVDTEEMWRDRGGSDGEKGGGLGGGVKGGKVGEGKTDYGRSGLPGLIND